VTGVAGATNATLSITRATNTITINVRGTAGATYQIEAATAVTGPYSQIATVTLDANGAGSLTLPITGNLRFFRATAAGGTPVAAGTALLVVNNTTLGVGDAGVSNRLAALGFKVTTIAAPASTTADANNKSLVVVSSTITSGDVAAKFKDVAVPVLFWEQAIADEMQASLDTATNHNTTVSQTNLVILATTHPLAAGLPAGSRTVEVNPGTFSWAVPAGDVIKIAAMTDDPTHLAIFGYEAGANMLNSFKAPAKRVFFFLQDTNFVDMTSDGLRLFDAAVNWAAMPARAPLAVGLNFGANEAGATLAPTNVAGVSGAMQANWNNLVGPAGTNVSGIVADALGTAQVTPITVSFNSANTWASTGKGEENNGMTNADRTLTTGYLDTGSSSATFVVISNIPPALTASGYDVYVYTTSGSGGRGGAYRITDTATNVIYGSSIFAIGTTNSASYIAAGPNGAGTTSVNNPTNRVYTAANYLVFRGLTAPAIRVEASTVTPLGFAVSGTTFRAPIDAIQLVQSIPSSVHDVTMPGAPVFPSSTNSPAAEISPNTIDNTSATKYLNFDKLNTGVTITTGPSIVTGLSLTSANDAPERDPASYKLEGSNNGTTFTLIAQGAVPAFTARFQRQEVAFANNTVYSTYRLTFPTVANATSANSMQVAEIELLGHRP